MSHEPLVLLLNAGSSSLKFSLLETSGTKVIVDGQADWAGETAQYRFQAGEKLHQEQVGWRGHAAALERAVQDLQLQGTWGPDAETLLAVGHRIVHGGDFDQPVRIDESVRKRLEALADLAPLHNPPGLATVTRAEKLLPAAKHICCFDTTFHATLPPAARTYAIPWKWRRDWGIRRYGFHGLSHAYCSRRASALLKRPLSELRLVICHLGHGCSACAVRGGRSIDTTMGFTPLDGLMMGTRSGSIDPGAVLHVQQQYGLSANEVLTALNRQSGLLGVSQLSADLREVTKSSQTGNTEARLALDIYTYRLRQIIGAYAVTLGGIDALVFTAGVGEHSAPIREEACRGLSMLGLELDLNLNAQNTPDTDIASRDSRGRILVIHTREDLTMRDEVMSLVTEAKPLSADGEESRL